MRTIHPLIYDYNQGNLFSWENCLRQLGLEFRIGNSSDDLEWATHIVLPGVGHFAKAMESLIRPELIGPLEKSVFVDKKPVLGVCLGMQLMFDFSEEGDAKGLGWIKGNVRGLELKNNLKIPHVGWNTIDFVGNSIFQNMNQTAEFYFVHSYCCEPSESQNVLCSTYYGSEFVSGVMKENLIGFQFHPEKSGASGLALIQKFLEL